LTGSDTCLCH